ncbi:DUF5029 domain-containing protein [Bacteroides fragilis]|uniref:DUF5029 domain-containing protein n=1 Tax=Bacteroides fragilis TaxID=817 RepID=UPI0004D6E66B|nr:DUF5029 domain-containing protein [Bacteroides fragilis]MCE8573913.1 DUF5029 domain-containing protein [Bacteroides fragilis]QCQ32563.1 DUF5029 domain-containing protein [Bacteroides fragilis]UHZ81235.1 DUF5029 domain-containing protein [Bacteroides fragilis]
MKLNKLFTFTLAALAMAACSNDDEPGIGGGGQKGEIIDAINIAFTNSTAPATRADKGEIEGVGTENNVYVAYLFAKENDPQHEGAKVGDWTVKRVAGDNNAEDADVVAAIGEGDVATPGTKKNMCTFNGVRQGDSVYVIVNDPQMTLATAQTLAHQADKSEAAIRGYISNLSKSYLNDLTVTADGKQAKKYIMAGVSAIPTNPNIPNGSTVKVSIPLNRELAKVFFNASVTTNPVYEAYGKMAIKDTEWKPDGSTADADGIVVVRIPRRVSPFTAQARDWYFPQSADATAKDWDVEGWLKAFAGEKESVPGTAEVAGTPALNKGEYNADAKEYRLTWVVGEKALTDGEKASESSMVYVKSDKLYSPYFYVTPNYANNAGCATVVVTQATYIGTNTLLEPTITEQMLKEALADATFQTATSTDGSVTYDKLAADFWNTGANVTALVAFLETNEAYKLALRGETEQAKKEAAITIKPNDKRYYRADVANYSDDETTSMKITERNTFYHITGTITTLGAKTIEDAINSDNIDMLVQVVVKPWKYVVNNINM